MKLPIQERPTFAEFFHDIAHAIANAYSRLLYPYNQEAFARLALPDCAQQAFSHIE